MKGQSNLIATVIMIGITLVVGTSFLAYSNLIVAYHHEKLIIQQTLYDTASSLVFVKVVHVNNSAVFFMTSQTGGDYALCFVGIKKYNTFVYLAPGTDYRVFVANDTDITVPGTSGWVEAPFYIYGTNTIIYDVQTRAKIPVSTGVVEVSLSPNEPRTFLLYITTDKNIDAVRVYVLYKIAPEWYTIDYIDVPVNAGG